MVQWEEFYNAFRRPDFIPGYEIQHRLGGGAFGEVFKARKSSIGKPYAIKFLRIDDTADREVILRELEQVRLFASIDHPNLVTIEDMGMVLDVPYLILGYAGDETLARRLKRGGLDPDWALRTFVQVCRGVLALHDRRLAHFDLKPGNVFLKGDVARVGDYGLAKLLVEGCSSLSFGRGTPHYMAPEMLRNRADHRADIYSLGVILYECVAGRVPFGSGAASGVVLRESDDPPAFPADFPTGLRGTVETCLRIDPDQRFDSVHELLEDMGQTARQGDSVRIPWKVVPPLRDPPAPAPARADAPALAPATSDVDERQGERQRAHGNEVISLQKLGDPESTATPPRGRPPAPVAPVASAPVASGASLAPANAASSALASSAPEPRGRDAGNLPAWRAALGAAAARETAAVPVPVPVPPRAEGGLVGTVTSTVVLGAEILGAILTGPVVTVLRGIRSAIDALVRGLPGMLGAGVRLVLFMLLFMGLGAVTALIFMGAVMGGNLQVR